MYQVITNPWVIFIVLRNVRLVLDALKSVRSISHYLSLLRILKQVICADNQLMEVCLFVISN